MQQYFSIKEKYQNEVLFFRLGDFYEMFDEDAREVSRLLNLTLTHRNSSPMCGIPFHAAKNYIKRLLSYGKKIAICEQLELSDAPNQIARREVIQVITPATVVEQEFIDSGSFNYLLSVFGDNCAYCDISTGDLRMKHLESANKIESLMTVIEQTRPTEVLVCDDEYFLNPEFKQCLDGQKFLVNKLPASYFSVKDGYKFLCSFAHVNNLDGFGLKSNDKLLGPAGSIVRYVQETAKLVSTTYFNYQVVDEGLFMQIDDASRRNLELFTNNQDQSRKYSLFDSICRTCTSGGQRLLESWLSFPLVKLEEINFRQDWVKWLVQNDDERQRIRSELDLSLDLQRLTNRVSLKRAIPKDLVGIKHTLAAFFRILSRNTEQFFSLFPASFDTRSLNNLNDLMMRIDQAVNEECNGPFMTGSVILDGYDSLLDENRSRVRHSEETFAGYLDELKSQTGITTMKIVNSRVSGYVIEVSKSQIPKVPSNFFRRQTLVNSERYTTDILSRLEQESQEADNSATSREKFLYDEILNLVACSNDELNEAGRFLCVLDCLQSFATQAIENNYCCPFVVDEDVLEIKGGRHPVVERHLPPNTFVPNDTDFKERFFLITGPNMAGKSTYLRQNALIVLLAHIGSFVPADEAVIGLTDKIYCRVGASDNLAKGESTFLVEMEETSYIVRTCTRRSLVIMDEIGRGTSTQEGMSIAYAIIQFLLKKGSKTLFATHFHELCLMDTTGMELFTLAVQESPKEIKFLRKLISGSASSSYALHVARMAGIPSSIIKEASSFQKKHFSDYGVSAQASLFADDSSSDLREDLEESRMKWIKADEILQELKDFDLDSSTPFQAMLELQKIKEKIKCI